MGWSNDGWFTTDQFHTMTRCIFKYMVLGIMMIHGGTLFADKAIAGKSKLSFSSYFRILLGHWLATLVYLFQNSSKYVYIVVYILTYIHTYIHACMHACIHTYIHIYIYIRVDIYIYTCRYIYIYIYVYTKYPYQEISEILSIPHDPRWSTRGNHHDAINQRQ